MQLGFQTIFSEENVRGAAQWGFDSIEVHSISWDENEISTRRGRKRIAESVRDILERYGITISAIALYDAPMSAKDRLRRFRTRIELCNELGVECLATLAGNDTEKTLDENLVIYKKMFTTVAGWAEGAGVKIAFENWPGIRSPFPPAKSVNLAFTPDVWEKMFHAVHSDALGLEFDPSHFVWQGMDYLAAVRKFASRIYHVHGKDTEIREDVLSRVGIFGKGWWRYRIPGFGRVDWPAFISTLKEVGYDGAVTVENEDPVFCGPRSLEGIRLGYNHLRPLICA
ncbi:MAG: sugar phosphate isomerase/epimerase family protein [Planctomycetia bacterium]|nr:sugar phosphate isomerase/epimerase family protein [Planctomycetia bacterium]